MGNCIAIDEPLEYGCGVCHCNLGIQYIYCAYCHKRFHHRCVMKHKSIHIGCPSCKQDHLRFIDKELQRNQK